MAKYKVTEVEGIGPSYGKKLNDVGIINTEQLLKAGATKKGRQELSQKTGIDEKKILSFTNMVDLFRIHGVGSEYAELLKKSGVDTVIELATRKPENLLAKMEEVNNEKHLVRRVPVIKMVDKWVKQAKELPRAIEY